MHASEVSPLCELPFYSVGITRCADFLPHSGAVQLAPSLGLAWCMVGAMRLCGVSHQTSFLTGKVGRPVAGQGFLWCSCCSISAHNSKCWVVHAKYGSLQESCLRSFHSCDLPPLRFTRFAAFRVTQPRCCDPSLFLASIFSFSHSSALQRMISKQGVAFLWHTLLVCLQAW